MGVNKPTGGFQFTAMTGYGTLSYDLTRPSNTWNFTQNMGVYSVGSTTGGPFAFLRSGSFVDTSAGVFTLLLDGTPSLTDNSVGFRCVVR
jgi:hypothetical protein